MYYAQLIFKGNIFTGGRYYTKVGQFNDEQHEDNYIDKVLESHGDWKHVGTHKLTKEEYDLEMKDIEHRKSVKEKSQERRNSQN